MKKLIALIMLFFTLSDHALAELRRTYNFGLGAVIPTGTEHIKNAADVGPSIRIGAYRYTEKRLALGLDYDLFDFSDDTTINNNVFTFNTRYHFTPFYKRLLSFAKAGIGLAFITGMPGIIDQSHRAFAAKTGIGFDYVIDTHWALGLEVDYNYIAQKEQGFTEQHLITPIMTITYTPGKNNFYYKEHRKKEKAPQ